MMLLMNFTNVQVRTQLEYDSERALIILVISVGTTWHSVREPVIFI